MLDRVKEALFGVLDGYGAIRGRVIDLYAGTGSLGIECLSRGAAWADFVEQNRHVCSIIRENLQHTKVSDRAQVYTMPVGKYLQTVRPESRYAIIVMDPPYADPVIEQMIQNVVAADILDDEGILIIGHSPRVELQDGYPGLARRKFRRLGDSCFSIYEVRSNEEPPTE
jgi:16S rRNA (guanine966-N2)-methyltransferase